MPPSPTPPTSKNPIAKLKTNGTLKSKSEEREEIRFCENKSSQGVAEDRRVNGTIWLELRVVLDDVEVDEFGYDSTLTSLPIPTADASDADADVDADVDADADASDDNDADDDDDDLNNNQVDNTTDNSNPISIPTDNANEDENDDEADDLINSLIATQSTLASPPPILPSPPPPLNNKSSPPISTYTFPLGIPNKLGFGYKSIIYKRIPIPTNYIDCQIGFATQFPKHDRPIILERAVLNEDGSSRIVQLAPNNKPFKDAEGGVFKHGDVVVCREFVASEERREVFLKKVGVMTKDWENDVFRADFRK